MNGGIQAELKKLVVSNLDELQGSFEKLREQYTSPNKDKSTEGKFDFLIEATKQLESDVSNLYDNKTNQYAVLAITSVENISTQFALLSSQLSPQSSFKLVQTILNSIKAISSSIWQLIARLLNLKSWSVAGTLSAGCPGFLSGAVQLQLTFE